MIFLCMVGCVGTAVFLLWAKDSIAAQQEMTPQVKEQVKEEKEGLKVTETGPAGLSVKTRDWGPEFAQIEQLFGRAVQDRKELNDLRMRNIERYLAIKDTKNPDFVNLAQDVTQETIDYIKKRITQTVMDLGIPPTNFAVFTMGSMAREESGFYTDLEIGILVEEKNLDVLNYFKHFAQKLSDRFFLLGEHPDVGGKGLRMDEADNSPAHLKFFARYACNTQVKSLFDSAMAKRDFDKIPFEGSRIFIATPAEFAQHADPNFLAESDKIAQAIPHEIFEEELRKALNDPANNERSVMDIRKEIANKLRPMSTKEKQISGSVESLMRNIRFLYGYEKLFNEYLTIRERYLSGAPKNPNPFYSNRREEIAFQEMRKDIVKHMGKEESAIVSGKLGKEIDIKRELYRFPEQILTDLGFWYNVGEQNTSKIAKLLVKKGVMSEEFGEKMVDLMNYFIGLRFKKQAICKKQTPAIPTTLEEFNKQKEKLEEEFQRLKDQRDVMVRSNAPQDDIEKIEKDVSHTRDALINFKKFKPLEEESILSPQEITLLNTKYLPILQELFKAAKAFIEGDKAAFLGKHGSIDRITLLRMFKDHKTDAILDALNSRQASPELVYYFASLYHEPEIEKLALKAMAPYTP